MNWSTLLKIDRWEIHEFEEFKELQKDTIWIKRHEAERWGHNEEGQGHDYDQKIRYRNSNAIISHDLLHLVHSVHVLPAMRLC